VNLELPPTLDRLPNEVELTIFRIIQEALANIRRHSGSRTAEIAITATSGEVKLSIRDYGKGIPPEVVNANGVGKKIGVGLRGMRERVRQLGGTLSITAADPGTIVEASIPLTEALRTDAEAASAISI
jgi:signal transduction histidine kinase